MGFLSKLNFSLHFPSTSLLRNDFTSVCKSYYEVILNRFRNNDLTLVYFIQLYVSGMEGFLFENFMLRDTSLSQLKNLLRKLITRHEIVISIV